ncbi:MAG: hypothetical protein ACUVWX_04585 [Kiritimatiellia bacterium]
MRSYVRKVFYSTVFFWVSAIGSGSLAQQPREPNVRDLRLPLQHYEDGRIRLELRAAAAHVPPSGPIRAWNARLDFYDPTGVVEATVESDNFRYDRATGIVSSRSEVCARRADLTLTGTGFEWIAEGKIVKVLANVRVVIERPKEKKDVPALP